jgi:hypothetical protein
MRAKDKFNKLSPHCLNGPYVIERLKYTTHTNRAWERWEEGQASHKWAPTPSESHINIFQNTSKNFFYRLLKQMLDYMCPYVLPLQ